VRAMILAAGLGTRMRPLSDLRAKPALPVRGRPVISLLLEFLSHQGCREVMINLHHRPETIRAAVGADHPSGMKIDWSEEDTPLGTGGGLRKAENFLTASEDCVVLAGDMLLDVPLKKLFDRHVASERHATLLLREDKRVATFGSIGINPDGFVTRIGKKKIRRADQFALEGEAEESVSGLFTGVRFFKAETLTDWPAPDDASCEPTKSQDFAFEDLRDWLIPGIETRGLRVGAEVVDGRRTVWEPVGTPNEYLEANLVPPDLPTLGGSVANWTGSVAIRGDHHDVIVSQDAEISIDADLDRCVVWDGEKVPSGFRGHSGVYAGGEFHPCSDDPSEAHSGALQ
jgi:NDP-sugar pyrophosphorylase family protein